MEVEVSSYPSTSSRDVLLSTSAWVIGTRAIAYFGPVSSNRFTCKPDYVPYWMHYSRELMRILKDLQKATARVGGTHVLGLEVWIAIEDEGMLNFGATGTAAKLVYLR